MKEDDFRSYVEDDDDVAFRAASLGGGRVAGSSFCTEETALAQIRKKCTGNRASRFCNVRLGSGRSATFIESKCDSVEPYVIVQYVCNKSRRRSVSSSGGGSEGAAEEGDLFDADI